MTAPGAQAKKMPARPALLATAALCIAFGAVYTIFWKAGATAMRQTIATLSESGRVPAFSAEGLSTSGFPFFLRGELRRPSLVDGGYAWSSARLTIDALPINPQRFVFTPADVQSVALGRWGAFEVSTEGARASLDRRGGHWVVDAQADGIAARSREGSASFSGKGLLLKAAPEAGAGLHVSLFAGAFDWSVKGRTAAGEKLLADVAVTGGRADLRKVIVETGGSKLELKGEVMVGADGYPAGQLDAKLVNPAGAVDALVGLGALAPHEAKAAAAALSLAAVASGGALVAPVELAGGEARLAGVRVARLPKIR